MLKSITTTFSEDEFAALIRSAVGKVSISESETTQTEIINRNELCKRLDITEPTAIRWEKKGKIPCFRIGSNVRYNWHNVINVLEGKSTKNPSHV